MTGVLILLGMVAAICLVCDGWDALKKRHESTYKPAQRSNVRLIRHPFDWAKDPEVTQ